MEYYCAIVLIITAVISVKADHSTLLCNGIRSINSSPYSHTGYIASPNHPRSYPAENLQCTFKFIPKQDEQVQLTFSYFNLRESKNIPATTNCDLSDSVKIFVGTTRMNSDPGNQIGEYCGKKAPENVMAAVYPLTVTFTVRAKEDPSVNALYMFKAKYTFLKNYGINTHSEHAEHNKSAGCHFIFDGRRVQARGSFDSPNFGGLYPFATNCLYTFKSFGNQTLILNFDRFDVDGQSECRKPDDDVLYFKEGEMNWNNFFLPAEEDNMKRDPNTTMYCGYKKPAEFTSQKPVVNVIFKSGQMRTKHGFKGHYAFVGHPGQYLPPSDAPRTCPVSLTFLITSALLLKWSTM